MAVIITGNNTPTAGGITYGDGTTYANTAAGTSGQPVVSGGASAPVFRPYTLPAADGSASQVLQTNGSGALSFATPSTGAMTFISTATASSSATIDIALSGAYTSFQIVFNNVRPATNNVSLSIQYTSNNFSSATDWENTVLQALTTGAANVSTTTAGVILIGQVNTSTSPGNGVITLINPLSSAVTTKSFIGLVQGDKSGDGAYTGRAGGTNNSTSALNGVRFLFASGNVTSGTFKLYGIT